MKHILKTRRPLIIYNPTLVFDRDYFSACARAGALPVFDMEFFSDEAVREALNALENESFLFGVRIDLGRTALILEMEKGYIPNLDLMVFSYKKKEHLNDFSFSNKHYRFFMEARHIDLNDQFERIDPNGLILKGCEAPGMVSPYTSFILMQWYLANSPLAIFIHGGVGLYTAAGMFAAGVSGLVLDNQLYLCDEAPLDPSYKKLLADVTETDTALVGEALDTPHRFFAKLGTRIVKSLKEKESRLILDKDKDADQILLEDIRENICPLNQNGNSALQSLFYLGQDAAFAKSFIRDSSRLSDVLDLLFQCIRVQIHAVDDHDPLVEDSPLAREHGTRYPVIQGPMANISDNPSFAKTIHDHGGLPFFAMGNLPGDLSETLISEGKKTVPRFGAGLIGIETFNKTIHRHLELLKEYKVPFALFAGGIPSQVKELEQAGTKTYLHTPNMMMLDNAMESGCTRFIFEGTEAGGHVGSLSSFVLWEAAMTRIMAQDDEAIGKQSLIFAGGISSVYASCFISGLASVLSRKKAKIGIQVGSAYLFTKEIVALKGIAPLYQNTLTQSKKTIVTGNTVGLPSRTVPTPFALKLVENEHARIKDGMGLSERKTVFEEENLGSLLISAKGFLPDIHGTNKGKPIRFSDKEQYEKGNFLVGDSLAFLNPGITISQIHDRYFNEKHVLFSHLNRLEIMTSPDSLIYDDIAVIGMGCILPDAPNPDVLWENILSGRYSIRDMPEDRMDPALYVDTDKQAEDKSYTKIAGLVTDFHFDHETYGYTQSQADKISRSQKMILESAFQAVSDAGYLDKDRQFRHDKAGRTGVIIASCLGNEKSNDLHLKSYYPELRSHLEGIDAYKTLPENQKETLLQALKQDMSYGDPGKDPVDGVALHMDALRLARHLKTKGIAYVVDAACATSFTAMDCAMRELLSGRHDTMIVAGNNTNLSPEAFIGFGKMGALSAEGSYPFDQRANGFVLGEGTAVFVLKRLKDAIRQKSAIHGVIKGIGSSSDGKGKAIAAPNPAGQKLALLRCYENIKNPFTVSDIDYIEAHGTSTIMGDQAEIETLKNVYKSSEPIGISSIKSQIGHLLGGAGAAGLLKVLLAMKHRTLPPNGQFQTLSDNMDLSDSPLYIITEPKPWTPTQGKARKAAISSYGFGGINYHVVVEEYSPACPQHTRQVFPETDMDPDDNRIVFVGLGVVLPGAINSDALSKRLPSVMLEPGPMPSDRFALGYYADEPDQVFRLPHIKAGIVDDFKFNNVKYRIPPMAAKSIDRAQLFALDATSQALENSGAGTLLEMGNKIAVILGTVSGKHHAENIFRVRVPYMEKIIRDFNGIDKTILDTIAVNMATSIRSRYPKNTEDTVPGFLSNIVSGRIANFFGCNGANFVVDAGDASSAIAMDVAAMGLRNHDFDLVLTGGVDTNLYPSIMLLYKDMGLLSGNGQSPVMSEGAAVMVMTRLKTAREKGLPILGEYLGASFAMDHGNQGIRPSDEAKKKVENDCFKDMEIVKSRMDTHDSLASGFGLLRSAETAVNIAGTILRKDEASPLYTATSTWALGGLHGHIVTGSLSSRPSIKKSTTLKMDAAKPQKPRVVALLSGQGAQHPFMMKELYDHIPEIRHVMDRGEARFKSARNQSLLDMMFQENEALNLTENTQPAVFLSTAAIFDTLKKQGFSPDYLIGHSVGEFSALYCAGLLDFDQAMDLILTRSSLMKKAADTHPGKIMVVFDSAENTQALIRESGKTVYLANKNSLKQTGVSGETSEIEGFCTFLADKGVVHTKLSLSGAFHSPLFRETGQEMGLYMNNLRFNTNQAHRIISNVNARPYPDQEASIRELLVRQISSPVEFIASVQHVYQAKNTHFIEIGPTRLLANLLKNMDMDTVNALSSVTPKKGQLESFKAFVTQLKDLSLVHEPTQTVLEPKETMHDSHEKDFEMTFNENQGDDFSSFVKNNEEHLKKMLYSEYMKHKKQTAIDAFEKFDFNPGKIVVSGVAVGLPGTGKDVFDPKNFDKLLSGTNFIEPLPASLKELMVDKNVTRLQKDPDGNARFVEITTTEDVIQLAGQLGYFDLDKQYGIKMNYETTIALAMAAGIEALKDAKIPLVMQYKTTSTGSLIADGYALPAEMQDGTGVILSALWPYSETLIREMTHYFYNKFYVKPYEEFEKIYYHLMGNITDTQIKEHVTDWFFRVKERRTIYGDYKMTRDFAHNLTPLGSAHFAQYIRAKGPNIQMSGACASTTQAIGIAEDWIRAGRCERVIIIGGETPTSQAQSQWVGSGFLSLGAASVEKNVENAAKPFDAKRNGTILGSGAVSMIIEREEGALRRGMRGQAEVLGTHIGNTAHHVYNIDVKGISKAMNRFVTKVEKRHSLSKTEYSKNMVFMSHETFTPARGGSADAEITALRTTYPETYRDILITNTKGYTGHTLGAALEDAVLVKVLQKGTAPPIANLTDISEDFKDLRLSKTTTQGNYTYGLHIAAGFGSHLAFAFFKRIEENTVENNPKYLSWLQAVTGSSNPSLRETNNTLMAEAGGHKITPVEKPLTEILEPPAPSIQEDIIPATESLARKPQNEVPPAPARLKSQETLSPEPAAPVPDVPAQVKASAPFSLSAEIKKVIADQTGYDVDMLEDTLDLEADLGIDTVKQVEIFGKISAAYQLKVPENLKLKDLNTIDKLVAYMKGKVDPALFKIQVALSPAPVAPVPDVPAQVKSSVPSSLSTEIKNVIAAQTGYDVDMLEDTLDLEADLGIDTVKQVEIFGKISAAYQLKVPENLKLKDLNTIDKLVAYMKGKVDLALFKTQKTLSPEPAAPVPDVPAQVKASAPSSLSAEIKKVISDQTGYEVDMLDDTLDLEADLGIDTVKQVEIFGKISAAYQLKVPENLKLKDLNTIDKLVAYMKGKVDPALLKTQETLIPEPAAPVPDVPAQVKASAPSSLSAEIKKVISDQTGYEVDMLEDTLDLEADLGIDTVKQVEIFGKISAAYSLKVPENLKLKDLNSIAKLVAYMETRIPAPENIKAAPAPPPGAPAQATFTPLAQPLKKPGHSGVKRFTLVLCKAEKTESLENPFENKTILVTQDSYGFSDQICRDIRKKGGRPITMGKSPGSDIKADLADPMAVLKALQTATRVTDIRGLIHLAPIDGYLAGQKTFDFLSKKSNHTTRMTVALTSFFTMIKALKPQLDQDGSLIASLSFNSVVFPYETGFKGVIHPEFAGMAGLLKTVNKEYSKTRVRIIDFAEDKPRNKVNEISTLFIKDLCSKDKRVEKGYKNSVPWSLTMQETPLVKDTSFMHDGDTVLVTGGAMGITYEILKQTAQTHKINLIIMGRSTIHDLDPSYLLPGVTGSLIMSQVKARMKNAKPLDIKKAVDRIMRTREAVLNIKRLEGQGIKVFYENGDVANYAAVEQVVKKYPSITGVIHAAGLEESQFIEKKELASFKRVIDVKVTGLHNLIKAMINRDYRYFITFSSVTARFGNEGQADYTAANDMIGKMLMKEKINHPNRHYKVYAWTAWSGAGMAENDTVKKVLESRGITFLPLDEGIDFFVSDLENTQDLEVVITGPDRDADVEGLFSPISGQVESMKTTNLSRSYPFLDSKDIETGTDGRFHRTLNLGRDLFLHDHTMEGTPIFLGATGIETMAEAAAAVQGGQEKLVEVKDFSIPYGIKILKGRPKDIIIEAHAIHGKDYTCRITSVFTNPKGQVMGDATLHYQGLFTFDTEYLPSEQIPIPEFTPVSYKGDAESLIYHPRRLFMEDLFKTLTDVVSFDGELLITTFCDASPKPFFKDVYKPSFLTDVVAVDAMFQTGGLLEFFTTSTLVLPYKIKKLSVHKRVQKGETYYCLTRKTAQADETNTYDLVLVDMNGKVHITIHEFQMVKLGALDEPYRITDRIKILESA